MNNHPPAPAPAIAAAHRAAEPTVHHVSMRRRRGTPQPRMQVNLSAMIDVIFNLLIFFVVTASFAADEGVLTLRLPQGTGVPEPAVRPPEQPIEVGIASAGDTGIGASLTLQNRPFRGSFDDLAQRLASMQFDPHTNPAGAYRADSPVIIRPDGEVRWQHVVNAFNAAIRAQYTHVTFAQADR